MKCTLTFLLFPVLFFLRSVAAVPEGAIPFIFDRHLYLQATLNDTIPVTVVYDSGADFLYLDKDFLKLNNLQDAFGRRGKAKMGGGGKQRTPTHGDLYRPGQNPLRSAGISKQDYPHNRVT